MTSKANFKLAWVTDPHLNFVHEKKIESFARSILRQEPDALVITGDIAEGQNIVDYLAFLDLQMKNKFPIFFVLGNHDYYNRSIESVRERVGELFTYDETSKQIFEARLGYLGTSGVVRLTDDTALVGHDGWADGQYANWFTSKVWLADYSCISELGDIACPVDQLRFDKLNELAQECAAYVDEQTNKAFKDYEHVFVATHVPPFRENAVYNGKISDKDWMPHFSSKAMGDVLLKLAQENPDKRLTVLCGHSHGEADVEHLPNLRCITGEARYRHPKISKVFEI